MKIGILWDLDGTLLDTLEDLQDGVNHALARFGLPPRSREEVRTFVGNGARNLLMRAVDGRADLDEAVKAFHAYYDVNCIGKTRPYAGIPEALASLPTSPIPRRNPCATSMSPASTPGARSQAPPANPLPTA